MTRINAKFVHTCPGLVVARLALGATEIRCLAAVFSRRWVFTMKSKSKSRLSDGVLSERMTIFDYTLLKKIKGTF